MLLSSVPTLSILLCSTCSAKLDFIQEVRTGPSQTDSCRLVETSAQLPCALCTCRYLSFCKTRMRAAYIGFLPWGRHERVSPSTSVTNVHRVGTTPSVPFKAVRVFPLACAAFWHLGLRDELSSQPSRLTVCSLFSRPW